jgi:hypothetical protein
LLIFKIDLGVSFPMKKVEGAVIVAWVVFG